MSVDVDLSEAPRRKIHSVVKLPARAGPLALVYPKWIPGEHGPTGPIADLAGFTVRAGQAELTWHRDPVDMYRLIVDVPQGVGEVQVSLDYLSPPPGHGQFTSGASITQNLAVLNWHTVVVYPEGSAPHETEATASVRLPAGWKFGTALPGARREGDKVQFGAVSLETLIDSPLLAAAHLSDTALGDNRGAAVTLHTAAETEEELQLSAEQQGWLRQLVKEEAALFGARHFASYHFLLALTDSVPSNGIEHHESSDNRLGGRALLDKELSLASLVHLLAHESTHSWNGKHRRPASLTTPDYQQPMKGDLLWVYEGLTNYLGTILTARAGSWDAQALRDYFAIVADAQQSHGGRTWRPVQDTATAAQILYDSRDDWSAWRREVDFYQEGDLIWLEVDARLREKNSTLDEFCRRFHGGKDSGPSVLTYGFDDVARTLDALAPGVDFGALLRSRLDSKAPGAPLEGLARAGFRLDYSDTPSELFKAREKDLKHVDLRSSIGLVLDAEKETIVDVFTGRPADKAGVMPGAKLVAVNGRKFSVDRLLAAVAAKKPVELLVENADTYKTFLLDYAGGLRYPRLVPIEGKPDVLALIGKSLAR